MSHTPKTKIGLALGCAAFVFVSIGSIVSNFQSVRKVVPIALASEVETLREAIAREAARLDDKINITEYKRKRKDLEHDIRINEGSLRSFLASPPAPNNAQATRAWELQIDRIQKDLIDLNRQKRQLQEK